MHKVCYASVPKALKMGMRHNFNPCLKIAGSDTFECRGAEMRMTQASDRGLRFGFRVGVGLKIGSLT